MTKKLLAFGVLIIGGGLAVYFYQASRPVVEVVAARRGTAVYAIYGTVKVTPDVSFAVHARASGVLKYGDLLSRSGNLTGLEVRKGGFLGEVVNESLDRDYAKAEAEWRATRERGKLGPAGAPALKTQEAQVARLQKLVVLSNVPPSEVEQAVNALATARETVRQEEIELDRADAIARQEYGDLKERKERCKFISPIDGVVSAVNAVNGEFINEGGVPFVLATKTSYLEGQINEEDAGHVAAGMKAAVKLYAYPDRDLAATVSQVLPAVNNQRYTVNLNLDHPPGNLAAGETGEMNIISGARENALLIPARALMAGRVWVARDGVVEPRAVKVGFRNMERAEILDGLREGERVVVADQDLLRTGLRVRAVVINQ